VQELVECKGKQFALIVDCIGVDWYGPSEE